MNEASGNNNTTIRKYECASMETLYKMLDDERQRAEHLSKRLAHVQAEVALIVAEIKLRMEEKET